ncbi:AAA family ATPase [Kitasatospora sp. A2-31]|uniref:ATP-binding protein n=1 Tax=Kitasatospora sp. A2-31 TaxID=2916414 RepID=UPI001EEAC15B|nr:AAA family ATPase [Kitasatospora sp. A2-31]MCG6495333.1 AAA family ATPase [Kitasatospora sp. A2-31]
MPVLPFVGRADLLAELAAALADARAGRGGLTVLTGAAGAGKTRVAEEAVRRVQGFRTLWLWCPPQVGGRSGADYPLGPWAQAVHELAAATDCSRLVRSSPGLRALVAAGAAGPADAPVRAAPRTRDPEAARRRLGRDLAVLLRTAAGTDPLLLVLDDVHDADASTLRLLTELAAALRTAPALLLVTARDDDAAWQGRAAERAALLRAGRSLPVGPLGEPEVRTLLAAAGGTRSGPAEVRELLERTGGDAFFVTELLRHGGAERPGPLPATVRAAVAARLARLPGECARVLGAASVLGSRFALDVLARLAGVPLADLRAVLAAAADEGLLALVDPGAGEFRHELMREAVLDGLAPADRAALHARAGTVLAGLADRGRDTGPAGAARHLLLAGPEHAAAAAEFAGRAAERSARLLAFEDAVQWYGQALTALAVAGGDDARRASLLVGLGTARLGAGRREEGRADLLAAADPARRAGRPDLLARAALGLGSGPVGFEVELLDRPQIDLLAEARTRLLARPGRLPGERPSAGPADGAAALLAAVTARLSVAGALVEPDRDRLALAEEAVGTARESGDSAVLAYALSALCDARSGPAHRTGRRAWAGEIVDLARGLDEPDRELELLGRRLRLVALLEGGELAAVDAESQAYEAVSRALGRPSYAWYVPLWRGMRALLEGRYEDCPAALAETEELGRRADSPNAALLAATQRWCLYAETGRTEELARLLAGMPPLDSLPGVWPRVAVALVAAQFGDRAEARRRLAAAAPLVDSAPVDSEWLPMLAQAAEALALVGPDAPAVPARTEDPTGPESDEDAQLRALAGRLYDALHPHRGLLVVEGIGAAVRGPVHRHLGLLAGRLGRTAIAREHFAAALATARALGAPRLAERIANEAGALAPRGARLPAPAPAGEGGAETAAPDGHVFHRQGEFWQLRYAGEEVRLADSKGLRDLAALLARPGTPVPALDLATASAPAPSTARAGAPEVGADLHQPADTGELIDATARAAYRRRLRELDGESAEADAAGDAERSARIAVERDALVGQLSAAYGLGGRPRRTGSATERARTAVTARIRAAIDRISRAHPPLGRHLANAVRTGTLCVYEPERPVHWRL